MMMKGQLGTSLIFQIYAVDGPVHMFFVLLLMTWHGNECNCYFRSDNVEATSSVIYSEPFTAFPPLKFPGMIGKLYI
jgi:hypothetical protein